MADPILGEHLDVILDGEGVMELEDSLNATVASFVEIHPGVDILVIGQALLCSAAIQLMARLNMPPGDFAVLAAQVAELSRPEAEELRRAVLAGQGRDE